MVAERNAGARRSFVASPHLGPRVQRSIEVVPVPIADYDGGVFETAINLLATSGITYGGDPQDSTLFCSEGLVTRGQMAAFLYRALG